MQKVDSLNVRLHAAYSDTDQAYWTELQTQLNSLKSQGVLSSWGSNSIRIGSEAFATADDRILTSDVSILLVSPDFVASEFCFSHEMRRAVESHREGNLLLIPLIVREVDWSHTPFAELDPLPESGKAIESWQSKEDAFNVIANRISEYVKERSRIKPFGSSDPSPFETINAPQEKQTRYGRYVVEGVLGEGAFGKVFRAHDSELHRKVAIKVPKPNRMLNPEDISAYIAEAQLVANLDHPGLVSVFDVGRTDDGTCYVVSKLIDGPSLDKKIKEKAENNTRFTWIEATNLVATIAEALGFAHEHEIVHRDIKPANILLDSEDHPYLADFGLAIKEEDFDIESASRLVGTPAYMSPEQARGEGHRMDGRSDIFSLGVVFYELLAGRRPFRSKSVASLLHKIAKSDVKPPRQVDKRIPKELERICLKAMARDISKRYTTAQDFADDLRHFVQWESTKQSTSSVPRSAPDQTTAFTETSDLDVRHDSSEMPTSSPSTQRQSRTEVATRTKVVPKGLRSFDQHDAGFFLQLVQGPRDRNGIPESIRFWKDKVESTLSDQTFPIGLIYGPSGCGKSSLVRAGLIPTLDKSVVPVFVEATADKTEDKLIHEICKHTDSQEQESLSKILKRIRRGDGLKDGKKLLIIIDQFEQWLQAHNEIDMFDLHAALLQCDGLRVQCILMTRVDYMMGIHQFMRKLDFPIQEGRNSAAVDLFDSNHAIKVLTEFGRAFGKLPESDLDQNQQVFLEQSIEELSDDGKVVPLHIAVFAEMLKIKGRPWSGSTLRDLGGYKGIGLSFLDETFGALGNRPHKVAAQKLLKQLLPDIGIHIRGARKSRSELLAATGYEEKEFETLRQQLDRDLKLITVTDSEDIEETVSADIHAKLEPYFQLTHDFLVPSIREWVHRGQQETAKGRAELLLEERAAVWNRKSESRNLPGPLELIEIRRHIRKSDWDDVQRRMMQRASKYYLMRGCLLLACLAVVGIISLKVFANSLVKQLASAKTEDIPYSVQQISRLGLLTKGPLSQSTPDSSLRSTCLASVALLRIDQLKERLGPIDSYLMQSSTPPAEITTIAQTTKEDRDKRQLDQLHEKLSAGAPEERLRAACALAVYEPEGDIWSDEVLKSTADRIVTIPQGFVGRWLEGLTPIGKKLLKPLENIYQDSNYTESQRTMAARALGAFGPDDVNYWTNRLVGSSNKTEFDIFVAKLQNSPERAVRVLENRVNTLVAELTTSQLKGNDATLQKLDDLWVKLDTLRIVLEKEKAHQSANFLNRSQIKNQLDEYLAKLTRLLEHQDVSDRDAIFQELSKELVAMKTSLGVEDPEEFEEIHAALNSLRVFAKERIRESQNQLRKNIPAIKECAVAALALLRLEQGGPAWRLLNNNNLPGLRSRLIQGMASHGVAPQIIVNQLLIESNATIRLGLMLSLGNYNRNSINLNQQMTSQLQERLALWYESDPNSGIHSASNWLLQRLNRVDDLKALDQKLAANAGQANWNQQKEWYVTKEHHTIAVFRTPPRFLMGSPSSEIGREEGPLIPWEKQHSLLIPRTFGISTKEVTAEQFRRFRAEFAVTHEDPANPNASPANGINWYDAAAYCNFLSEREGIPETQWCYPREIVSGMKLPDDLLNRTGYRLPTEAEWEFACRAGTKTSRFFGDAPDLMPEYGRCNLNPESEYHLRSVGALKPNDYGLFDVYGNVGEWCHDQAREFDERKVGKATEDKAHPDSSVTDLQLRVYRGGGFQFATSMVRSAARDRSRPDYRYFSLGFRVAKTIRED